MGTSAAGIIINKTSKQINESIDFVLGNDFERVGYCDCRNQDCVYVGKSNDSLALVNSDLAEKLFKSKEIESEFIAFFNFPEMIFVFEEYDSGACYGYAIFKNGKLVRKLRTKNYNDVYDEHGLPDEDELEWINGIEIKDTDNDIILKNAVNGHEIPFDYKYKAILQLIMQRKFGFTCENMDDIYTVTGHFKKTTGITEDQKNSITIKNTNFSENKTKWWKFWQK